jgi:inner membrane protein
MNYRQHLIFGQLLGGGIQVLGHIGSTNILLLPTYYGGVALGSLLPDIDHPKSFLGSKIPIIPRLIYKNFGHRSITHSILGTATLGIATALSLHQYPYFILGNFIGYISHLLGDMLTKQGIPLFWPFEKKRYRICAIF